MTHFYLETTAGALAAALKTANLVRAKRATTPIFTAVLLRGRRMHATCLEMDISVPFAAKRMQGALAIDGASLALTRLLPADMDVSIQGGATGAILSFPGGSYDVMTYEASDFPAAMKGEDIEVLTGNQVSGFHEALAKVAYAISDEETRYYLNGVALGRIGGEPCVVATDGHRLAWHHARMPWPETWDNTIIPAFAVHAITKLGQCDSAGLVFEERDLSGSSGPQRRPAFLQVDCAGVWLITKLIDGAYPSWKKVVPQALGGEAAQREARAPRQVAVPVKPLRQALRRLASRRQPFHHRAVTLVPQRDGRLAISSRVEGKLSVEVLRPPTTAIADPLRLGIGCNQVYLGQLLSHAQEDEVILVTDAANAYIDPKHPTKNIGGPFGFRHENGGHIMMPMRTDTPEELDLGSRVEAVLATDAGEAA